MAPVLKVLLLSAGMNEATKISSKIILLSKVFSQLLQTPKKLGEDDAGGRGEGGSHGDGGGHGVARSSSMANLTTD